MAENQSKIWIGIGAAVVLFLVVTTPGWKEILGISGEFSLGGYAPALLLLLMMAGLLAIVMMGGEKKPE
ncbi:MAG TPA: hypothetical protein ENN60_03270 [archaeon]|nr:hypothetical protein [archaeon]